MTYDAAPQLRTVTDAASDAGRAIVATTIAAGEILPAARDVRADDLTLASHAHVWTLCRDLAEHGDPITPHSLATLAAQRGETARLPDGGSAGWAESLAADHAVVPARIDQLVDLVRAESARRKIERDAIDLANAAKAGRPVAELERAASSLAERARAAIAAPESTCISLAGIAPEKVTWLWTGRLAVGKVTVVDGLPGAGKSTVTCDLAARVSRGMRFPGDQHARPAGGVIFLAAEDGIADTVVPRLLAAGADLGQCHVWRAECLPSLPDDIAAIETAIQAHHARLLICDPVTALFARDLSANCDADVRRALTPLATLAEKHGVCVVLLRHLNKRSGISALDRGGGSIGIAALARIVLLLGKDESDPDGRVLAPVKANLTRAPRSMLARIIDFDGVGKIEWGDECDQSADDLVSDAAPQKSSKRDDAAEMMRASLADGEWHRQREIIAEMEEAGIAEKTWKRAKSTLGVESRQREREWWWRLPQGGTRGDVAPWPPGPLTESGPLRESNINHLRSSQGQGVTAPQPPSSGPLTENDPLTDSEDAI